VIDAATISTAGWMAIVAAAAAAIALVTALLAWRGIRRLRAAQSVVIAEGREDIVAFVVALQARLDDLHRAVDELASGLTRVDRRIDGSVTNVGVVRYDAYLSHDGAQSASIALLDTSRSGVVVSAIQGRDYARIYMKELDHGRSSITLSPEEQEAVERAMSR
jgi:NAD(P)-dependent dehydrogenase (short-subunit alcohol dehydrogenase family)